MDNIYNQNQLIMKHFTKLLASLLLTLMLGQGAWANTFYVTTDNASGPGSMAQAVTDANNTPGATKQNPHIIKVCFSGVIYFGGPYNIMPTTHMTIEGNEDMTTIVSKVNLFYQNQPSLTELHLTFKNCVWENNFTNGFGGAYNGGIFFIRAFFDNCLFKNNYTTSQGGAVFVNADTMDFNNCTFISNYTTDPNGFGGGAICNNGGIVTLNNCTFWDNNTACTRVNNNTNSAGGGGAIRNHAGGKMYINHCTFNANVSAGNGGAVSNGLNASGTYLCKISNSVVVGNTGSTIDNNLSGTFNSDYGHNIVGDVPNTIFTGVTTGNIDNQPTANVIFPLPQDNGHFIPTIRLIATSPAINAADAAASPFRDQRGFTRNNTPDAGAYEFGGNNPCNAAFSISINEFVYTCNQTANQFSFTRTGGIEPRHTFWYRDGQGQCGDTTYFVGPGTFIAASYDDSGCVARDTFIIAPVNVPQITNFRFACNGQTVTLGDSSYTANAAHVQYYGCDSTVTTYVFFNSGSFNSNSYTICPGTSVTEGDSVYSTAGTFYNFYNCDTVQSIITFINPPVDTNTYNICSGDFVQVGNNYYYNSGIYTDYFYCDSAVVSIINVINTQDFDYTYNACPGSVLTFGPYTYTQAGQYFETYGCDSTVTRTIIFNNPVNIYNYVEICPLESVTVGDSIYNLPGSYINTFNCDSIVYTDVYYRSTEYVYNSVEICQGQSITVATHTYDSTGVYYDTTYTALGCDTIIETDLTVLPFAVPAISIANNPAVDLTSPLTIGAFANVVYNGSNTPGNAFDGDTVTYGWGGDGGTNPQWLGYNYGPGNAIVLTSYGIYNSCDQIGGWCSESYNPKSWAFQAWDGTQWITLDTVVDGQLSIGQLSTFTFTNTTAYESYRLNMYAGEGGNLYPHITELFMAGTGPSLITASDTYDEENLPEFAFDNETQFNGWGNEGDGLPSWLAYDFGAGNAQVLDAYTLYNNEDQNGGWDDDDYNPSSWAFQAWDGTQWLTLDTIANGGMTMGVKSVYPLTNNNTAYEKYRFYFTGSGDGDYVRITEAELIENQAACGNSNFIASLQNEGTGATLNWKVNGTTTGLTGEEVNIPGLTNGDIVTCDLTPTNLCQTANLVVSNSIVYQANSTSSLSQTACGSYTFGGNVITQSGTYTDTLVSAGGCDSVVVLTLTINAVPAVSFNIPVSTLCIEDTIISLTNLAQPVGGVFGGSIVVGNTLDLQNGVPGTYTVTYTVTNASGCSNSASDSVTLTICPGFEDVISAGNINLFPNPTQGNATITADDVQGEVLINIYNTTGQLVYSANTETKGRLTHTLDLNNQPAGTYVVKITGANINASKFLVIGN
jgi:hypothetical protein